MNRKFHWVPDVPDYRDYKLEFTSESDLLPSWIPHQSNINKRTVKIATPTTTLPPSVDLREFCSPIKDQEGIGACTGNAIVSYLEYLENKNKFHAFVHPMFRKDTPTFRWGRNCGPPCI